METCDVIIAGGGIIGISLAIELRRAHASVVVLERGEPGREASYAAAGMLAAGDPDLHPALSPMAQASDRMFPTFVEEMELRSDVKVGLESPGALYVARDDEAIALSPLASGECAQLEPALSCPNRVYLLKERSVDPRLLIQAAITAAKQLGVKVHHEARVECMTACSDRRLEVRTRRASYAAAIAVNCCGAWASEIGGVPLPTRPVKGQMLAVVPQRRELRHVIRSLEVYLLPRADGRVLIGSTTEEAGFDKTVNPDTIQALHQAAANLVPSIGEAKILEAWAGLRPGSPDDLPILGPGPLPGSYAASGHFRNGILLAPITAQLMTQLIQGKQPDIDLQPFSPARFSNKEALAG